MRIMRLKKKKSLVNNMKETNHLNKAINNFNNYAVSTQRIIGKVKYSLLLFGDWFINP